MNFYRYLFSPLLLAILIANFFHTQARATIVHEQEYGGVAHFLVDFPARWERYDLASRTWLAPVTLPGVNGVASEGWVDADGYYVAYANSCYRYDATGTTETHLLNVASTDAIYGLHTDNNILLIVQGSSFTSVNKVTNTITDTGSGYYNMRGTSIAPSINRLLGVTTGISPADVQFMSYNDPAGTFGSSGDSPHHGSYSIGNKTWVFPGDGRFVDTQGNIYNSSSMSYINSFPSAIDALVFNGSNPLTTEGTTLTSYSSGLLPTGTATLSINAEALYVEGTDVIAAAEDLSQPNGIIIEVVPLSIINAPMPGSAVNPVGISYTPDNIFLDNAGIVNLFSKAHQSIFRWDPTSQQYLDTIPLIGVPDYVAYSSVDDITYLAYTNGLIRKIDTSTPGTWNETPFATIPSAPQGLQTAGSYLFTVDDSGAWDSHYTFDNTGVLIDSLEWNHRSVQFEWSDQNQKMYFFRYSSPTDLLAEEINADGVTYSPAEAPGGIGNTMDSPLHTSTGFTYPIRIKPDGSIAVLGSGVIHDAHSLARLTIALGNTVDDLTWLNGELKSIRTVAGISQLQHWTLPTYAVGTVAQYPGTAHRLLTLNTTDLLAITIANDGIPSFYILDCNFDVQAPPSLQAPINLNASLVGLSQIDLSWTDTSGELDYVIEKQTNGGSWTQIATTATSVTALTDTSVSVGNTYCYRVIAQHGALVSPPSIVICVDMSPPLSPSPLSASASAASNPTTEILVTWGNSLTATNYQLERRTGSSGSWTIRSSSLAPGATSYTDTFLVPNTYYEYRILATNGIGDSPYSIITGDTTHPVPPTTPSLSIPTVNSTSALLSWSDANYESSYTLERSPAGLGAWTTIGTMAANVTSYTDTGLTPTTSYDYRVTATNSIGTATSNTVGITTIASPPPSAPVALVARVLSGNSVNIEWNDTPDETSYILARRITGGIWTTLTSVGANVTSYTDTSVSSGIDYSYQVFSVNSVGVSPPSNVDTVRPGMVSCPLIDDFDPAIDTLVWAANSGISFNGGTGFGGSQVLYFDGAGSRAATTIGTDVSAGGYVEFSVRAGNALVDGNTYWNNSETGENIVLEYSTDGLNWTIIQTLSANYPNLSTWEGHSIDIPTAAHTTSTSFRWRQLSNSGASFDTWAIDDVCVRAYTPTPPATPIFILSSPDSSTQITVFWGTIPAAMSYQLERSIDGINWTIISTTATSHVDTGLTPMTYYSYRVAAVSSGGNSPYTYVSSSTTHSQFDDWRVSNFGTPSTTGSFASSASGADGVTNLMRFASGLDATEFAHCLPVGGAKGLPFAYLDASSDRLCIEFIRRKASGNPNIVYVVEFSNDLVTWISTGSQKSLTPIDSIFERVLWEDSVPTNSTPKRFVRLRVTE